MTVYEAVKFETMSETDVVSERLLRPSSSTRPAVRAGTFRGRPCVIKDYRPNRLWYRNTVGRFLVWREKKALQRLQGITGVPALYGVVDGVVLIMDEVQGRSLENLEKEMRLSKSYFKALEGLVEAIHQRGIAHCDLKRAPNVMVDSKGQPHILDWGASISAQEFRLPPLNLIYRRFLLDDQNAITKLKLRHIPDDITSQELRRYEYRSTAERFIRTIRDRARELLKQIA